MHKECPKLFGIWSEFWTNLCTALMFTQPIQLRLLTAGPTPFPSLCMNVLYGRSLTISKNASKVHVALTYAVGVRVVGEVPLRVVAEGAGEVGARDVRLEDEALGAREGDVVEVGGDAADDAALVVRREVDRARPGAVRHRGGEEGVRLEGRALTLSTN